MQERDQLSTDETRAAAISYLLYSEYVAAAADIKICFVHHGPGTAVFDGGCISHAHHFVFVLITLLAALRVNFRRTFAHVADLAIIAYICMG